MVLAYIAESLAACLLFGCVGLIFKACLEAYSLRASRFITNMEMNSNDAIKQAVTGDGHFLGANHTLDAMQREPDRRLWFCGSYALSGIPLLESAAGSA